MKLKFIIIIAFLCIFLLVPINVEAVYRTITVDGDTSDWIGINPSIDDPNENDIDDYYDIDKIYIANDNDNLYFWIQFYGACQVGVGWFWINIYYQDSSTVFTLITDGSSIFSNPDCTGLQVGVSGQDMELGIPLNCIENPQCIYLYTFSFEMIDLMRDYAPDEDVPPVLFQYCLSDYVPSRPVGGELSSINMFELLPYLLVPVLAVLVTMGLIFKKKFVEKRIISD